MEDPRLRPEWQEASQVDRDLTSVHDGQEDTEQNKGEYLEEVSDPDKEKDDGSPDDQPDEAAR